LRRDEEGRAREERERQRREQELGELRKLIAEEEKKVEQFNLWMDNWEKAERMRRLIACTPRNPRPGPLKTSINIANRLNGRAGKQIDWIPSWQKSRILGLIEKVMFGGERFQQLAQKSILEVR
jgi:hypothetical protein